jgi:hypothetical protein
MNAAARIEIGISDQRLTLFRDGAKPKVFTVSTAKNGPGERMNSFCTPCGAHVITEKIGAGAAPGMVFVGRIPTGEVYASGPQPGRRGGFP